MWCVSSPPSVLEESPDTTQTRMVPLALGPQGTASPDPDVPQGPLGFSVSHPISSFPPASPTLAHTFGFWGQELPQPCVPAGPTHSFQPFVHSSLAGSVSLSFSNTWLGLPASCPPTLGEPDCGSFTQSVDTNMEPEMECREGDFLLLD